MCDTAEQQETSPLNKVRRERVVSIVQLVMLCALAVAIIIPFVTMDRREEVRSVADNRLLQPPYDANLEMTFSEQIEAYFSDRIGYRNEMIKTYSALNDTLFDLMVHPMYEYGDEGYVYFRFEDPSINEEFLEEYSDYIKMMQDYCTERGITFLYSITPEKARVYPEFVPDTIMQKDGTAEALRILLDEKDVDYIDLADPLIAAKDDAMVFNKVYNAGHWNSRGAFEGVSALLDRLREHEPYIGTLTLDDYMVIPSTVYSLPASNYPIEEEIITYKLRDAASGAFRDESYDEDILLDENYQYFRYYQNENQPDAPSLLMFQGSYFNGFDTMSYHQFSQSTYVHNYENVMNLPYYINLFEPDIVVFESADYTVSPYYYSLETLDSTVLPKPYETYSELPVINLASTLHPTSFRYSRSDVISNLGLTWDGPDVVGSIYAFVGEDVYECSLHGDEVTVGLFTEDLLDVDEIVLRAVSESETKQYEISIPLIELP